jgi:hypothetical protein
MSRHPYPIIVMQFISGTPIGIISNSHEIIEIKLWEAYLLNDRNNIHKALTQFSIDHGPVESIQHEPGRIIYRFHASDWENDIKHILYENRIPVVIKPTVVHDALPGKRHSVPFHETVLA